jgi:SAM-dependent methyltransferase
MSSSANLAVTAPLPRYEPGLTAFHRAHRHELHRIIEDLPLQPGDRVLDVPCGDGCYAVWLAERVQPGGSVVGADCSLAYLDMAREQAARSAAVGALSFVAADVYQLPFEEGSFDFIWCSQSFVSLTEPERALREMKRILRPGGMVGVMENDEVHHLLFPWPAEMELAIRQAQLRQRRDQGEESAQITIGRRLRTVLRSAGLRPVRKTTYATDRQWPLNGYEQKFLGDYLQVLCEQVRPYLEAGLLAQLERMLDPGAEEYFFRDPNFELTCLDVVFVAQVGDNRVTR